MHRGLAAWAIGAALAGARHPLHHSRALHQQRVQRVVDPIEFGAQRSEAARPAILRWWFLRRGGGSGRRVEMSRTGHDPGPVEGRNR